MTWTPTATGPAAMRSCAVVAVAAGLAIAGCSEDADTGAGQPSDGNDTPGGVAVSRADVGAADWPLTVSSGTLTCDGTGVVFTAPDGTEYGVNGTAMSMGYREIDEIWRDDPAVGGMKINISPVLDPGVQLCQ